MPVSPEKTPGLKATANEIFRQLKTVSDGLKLVEEGLMGGTTSDPDDRIEQDLIKLSVEEALAQSGEVLNAISQ